MTAKPTLFVTGASSFVGAHFCRLAALRGFTVRGLWRNTPFLLPGVDSVHGGLETIEDPRADVVVHLAAKVMADDAREQNRAMLDRVLAWGKPVVYASSTMVHWPLKTAYAESRREDEARVANSGLDYVILRPCAPYGPRLVGHTPAHKESFHTLVDWVKRLPAVPVVGDGRYRRQPVHVDDFNGALLALLERGRWRGAFDAGGPDPLTMRQVIAILGGHAGRWVTPRLRIPARAAWLASHALPNMRPELVRTFAMDDAVDPEPLRAASGVVPRTFEVGSLDLF
jgi:nucleoside-diphosphate-sugar epimerase